MNETGPIAATNALLKTLGIPTENVVSCTWHHRAGDHVADLALIIREPPVTVIVKENHA